MIYTFTVPMLPPSSQSPNSRAHFGSRYKDREQFMEQCGRAILGAGGKHWKFERAELGIRLVVTVNRRRDIDNAIATLKPIGDTLVQMGILPDDDSEHLNWARLCWIVDKARAPATIVTITEVTP